MITGTSVNYSGRKVDLSIFPDILSPDSPYDMKLSSSPKVIAGPAKAVQGFLVALMTRQGEVAGRPQDGTNFITRILTEVTYASDIEQIFLLEGAKAIQQWNDSAVDFRPLDEQIRDVRVTDSLLAGTEISLSVDLTTRGGDSIKFLLPVNWIN